MDENVVMNKTSEQVKSYFLNNQIKMCFASSFAWGFLAHGMAFFNKYSFHDDAYLFSVGATYVSGRWFLGVLDRVMKAVWGGSHYSIPLFNGVFTILCLALSSCLLITLLDICDNSLIIGVSGVITTFPMLAGLMGYMFTAPYYSFALLIIVFGAYIYCKKTTWWSFLISAVIVCCGTGIYQAFFPVATTILLLDIIRRLDSQYTHEWSDFVVDGLSRITLCVSSLMLYFMCTKLSLVWHHVSLTDYQGINQMGKEGIKTYLQRVIYSYKYLVDLRLLNYGSNDTMFPLHVRYIYYLVLVAVCILSLRKIVLMIKMSKKGAVQIFLAMVLFPLSINLIFVMSDPYSVHALMVYTQVFLFVYFAWLLEDTSLHQVVSKLIKRPYYWAAMLLWVISVMYVRYDNIVYLKAAFAQQEAISYFTSLTTQIKSTAGYRDEYQVVFINEQNISDKTLPKVPEWEEVKMLPVNQEVSGLLNSYNWRKFVRNWCGFDPALGDPLPFKNMPEVIKMPSYPDEGSIKIIDETVVVKF